MKDVVRKTDILYVGGDIVSPLVDVLNSKYRSARISFIHIDLTKGPFPKAHLMICRDCLFHLSFADAGLVLRNFAISDIPYLLTSTHIHAQHFQNGDITTGEFRLIDLFSAPYHLPREVLARIEDWQPPYPPREMCLWTREQVSSALAQWVRMNDDLLKGEV
jgi:hypothetical protein